MNGIGTIRIYYAQEKKKMNLHDLKFTLLIKINSECIITLKTLNYKTLKKKNIGENLMVGVRQIVLRHDTKITV